MNRYLMTGRGGLRHFSRVCLPEVLAALGQLVVLQVGEHLSQLHEEAFAGCVAVGIHVQGGLLLGDQLLEQPFVCLGEQGGRGDGHGLVSG